MAPFLVIAEEEFCKKRVYRFLTLAAATEASKLWHSNSAVFLHEDGDLFYVCHHCNQLFGVFAIKGIQAYVTELAAMYGNEDVVSIASVEFYKVSFQGNMRSRLVSHDGKKTFARFMTHDGHTVYDGADSDGKNTGMVEPLAEVSDRHAMTAAEVNSGA